MNEQLAKEKQLIVDNNKELYIYLENMYKYYFEKYLLTKVQLQTYDNEIKDSGLYFGISNTKLIPNGLKEFLNTEYICILNNFFIEKLSLEQLQILKDHTYKEKYDLTPEMNTMIESTFKDVIKRDFSQEKYTSERFKVSYGSDVPSNFAYNDDLVLKIYYSRNTKRLSEEEFIKNIRDKKTFLNSLREKLEKDIKENLDLTCTILDEKTNT